MVYANQLTPTTDSSGVLQQDFACLIPLIYYYFYYSPELWLTSQSYWEARRLSNRLHNHNKPGYIAGIKLKNNERIVMFLLLQPPWIISLQILLQALHSRGLPSFELFGVQIMRRGSFYCLKLNTLRPKLLFANSSKKISASNSVYIHSFRLCGTSNDTYPKTSRLSTISPIKKPGP